MAVSGVFSSCDTLAVKSCLLFAAASTPSCCILIAFMNGTSSLYSVFFWMTDACSRLPASVSIGFMSFLVRLLARTTHIPTMITVTISMAGILLANMFQILLAAIETRSTVPSLSFMA